MPKRFRVMAIPVRRGTLLDGGYRLHRGEGWWSWRCRRPPALASIGSWSTPEPAPCRPPGRGTPSVSRWATRCEPTSARRTTSSPRRQRQRRQRRHGRRAPRQRPGRRGHQRQRHRQRRAARDRDPDGRRSRPTNPVRFAWWGAEESGLLGSEHYVAELTRKNRGHRPLPELRHGRLAELHVRHLRRRQLRRHRARRASSRDGSAEIEDVFEGLLRRARRAAGQRVLRPLGLRPVHRRRHPAGGLFTGAEGPKSAAEAALYGGVAGAASTRATTRSATTCPATARTRRSTTQLGATTTWSATSTSTRWTSTPTRSPRSANVRLRHVDGQRRGRQPGKSKGLFKNGSVR